MSLYCTVEEYLDLFQIAEALELSNLDDPLGSDVDNSHILRHLTNASAEIDSYLRRYTLPISPIPEILRRICADMARYYLSRYDPPEDVRRRYEDALKRLMAISKGDIDLGLNTAGATIPEAGGAATKSGTELFGLKGWA